MHSSQPSHETAGPDERHHIASSPGCFASSRCKQRRDRGGGESRQQETTSSLPVTRCQRLSYWSFALAVVLSLIIPIPVAESTGMPTASQTTTPVPAPSHSNINTLAVVIAVFGSIWLLVVLVVALRISNMYRLYRKRTTPATPTATPATTVTTQGSRMSRRSGSFRDQQSSAGTGSFRAPSQAGSSGGGGGGGGGAGGSLQTDSLQGLAMQSASRASNWRPVVSNGVGSASLVGTSVSNSGGSGQGSGQSVRGFLPNMQRQTSRAAQRSIIQLAQEVTARGKTWHLNQAGASQDNPPGLSNLVGPGTVHQQFDMGQANTLPLSGNVGQGAAGAAGVRSPFFTPQSPATLSKVEMLSPADRPIPLQPLPSYVAPQDETATAAAAAATAAPAPLEATTSLSPAPLISAPVNNYANDMVRINSERRNNLTLPLGQSSQAPAVTVGEEGGPLAPPRRPARYLPMDGASTKPVGIIAEDSGKGTSATSTSSASAKSDGDMLTPPGFPSSLIMHEKQSSTAKSLKDQYASYEDMRHPQQDRRSSVSSRNKKSSTGSGETPQSEGKKLSLTNRIGSHFPKPGSLMMMLPGRKHSNSNSNKDIKGEQSPQPSTPTMLAPSSLATPNDHLREASIASALSAASLPLPSDQQRYVPFPIGTSPQSASHSQNLAMQLEASSQELSPAQSKALDL